MKYIISESRLEDIFEKYIDSQYDLVWDKHLRQFDLPNGEPFGNIFEKHFYFEDTTDKHTLRSMFGDKADELMFAYIRKRFPKVRINGVEDYGL
jgi:hypothetical protein